MMMDDLHRRSLLVERKLTDEERAAVADEPRPGVWAGSCAC